MAKASISVDHLTCMVCLDLMNDPVTVSCGHSFCMSCITDCWDKTQIYRCPICRQVFSPRPALGKNTILSEMIKKLKQNQFRADEPVAFNAGHGDVCDKCIGRKQKAVMSCLKCLKCYCHAHFKLHEEVYSGKHEVTKLQENICPAQLRTDEHRNTLTTEEDRTEKQKWLKTTQGKLQNYIRFKEEQVESIRDNLKTRKCSAQTERTAERRAEKLQNEIDALKKRDAELDKLMNIENYIQLKQRFQYFSVPDKHVELPDITLPSSKNDKEKLLKESASEPKLGPPTSGEPDSLPRTFTEPEPKPKLEGSTFGTGSSPESRPRKPQIPPKPTTSKESQPSDNFIMELKARFNAKK